jgi:hypothetical protein
VEGQLGFPRYCVPPFGGTEVLCGTIHIVQSCAELCCAVASLVALLRPLFLMYIQGFGCEARHQRRAIFFLSCLPPAPALLPSQALSARRAQGEPEPNRKARRLALGPLVCAKWLVVVVLPR